MTYKKETTTHDYMNSADHEYFYISYEIVVQDFGIGIPEERLKDLFINFSKLKDQKGLNNPKTPNQIRNG